MMLGNLKFVSYSLAACRVKSIGVFIFLGLLCTRCTFIFYSAALRPLHLGSFKITLFVSQSSAFIYVENRCHENCEGPNLVVWHAVWNLSGTVLRLCV